MSSHQSIYVECIMNYCISDPSQCTHSLFGISSASNMETTCGCCHHVYQTSSFYPAGTPDTPLPSCKPLWTILQELLYVCVKWAARCVGPCRGRRRTVSDKDLRLTSEQWSGHTAASWPRGGGRRDGTMGLFLQESQHVSLAVQRKHSHPARCF